MELLAPFILFNSVSFIFYAIDLRRSEIDADPLNVTRMADFAALFGSIGALVAVMMARPSRRRSEALDIVLMALVLHGFLAAIIGAVYLWPAV